LLLVLAGSKIQHRRHVSRLTTIQQTLYLVANKTSVILGLVLPVDTIVKMLFK